MSSLAGAPDVDAVLVVAFGGPEGPADVEPFLANVTRARGIPADRLAEVAARYLELFGGVSPLNQHTRDLVAALEEELQREGPDLPVYWGCRNSHPYLADTVRQMQADGVRHALALVTSAYPSYSGCRQYLEDIAHARSEVGAAPIVTKLRHYYAEDGFLAPIARGVAAELAQVGPNAHLLFTAHSLPTAGAAAAGPEGGAYVAALQTAAAGVVARLGTAYSWDLVFQSRSGPAHVTWLEPDVGDRLQALAATGTREVVLVPIGFLSDHVEVLYDLDHVAVSQVPGLVVRRAPTVGVAPAFVSMIRGLIAERITGPERTDHGGVATHDRCPAHCCLPAAKPQAGSA